MRCSCFWYFLTVTVTVPKIFSKVFVSICRGPPFWGILGGTFLYFLSNLQYFLIRFYIDVTGTTLKHFSKHAPLCCGLFWDIFHELSWYDIRESPKKKKKKNSMEPSFRWPFWGIFAYFKPFWSNSWNSLIYSREILYKCTWYYAGS